MRSKIVMAGLAGLLVVLVVSGSILWEGPDLRLEETREMMDTYVTIIVYHKDRNVGEEAMEAAFQRMENISAIATRFDNTSEVWTLNDQGVLENPSSEMREMMNMSVQYWNVTYGAFDITILPLLDLWGNDFELFTLDESFSADIEQGVFSEDLREVFEDLKPPLYELNETVNISTGDDGWMITSDWQQYFVVEGDEGLNVSTKFWYLPYDTQGVYINQTLPLVGSDMITIGPDNISIAEGMSITLDGVAKGYAVDAAMDVLEQKGIEAALVNAGGDITTIGTKPGGGGWVTSLQNPEDYLDFITEFEVSGQAIATSGNYVRYFNTSARTGHIMDPSTGRSSEASSSSTIIASTCAEADLLATAIFVLGPKIGLEVVESLEDVEALVLGYDNPQKLHPSSGLAKYEIKD